jgi:protein-S-isoprenylcysteine O-methyltransferase Ste14
VDIIAFTRIALPIAIFGFVLFAMVIPSIRLKQRTGNAAVVMLRKEDSVQQLIGQAIMLFVVGYVVWCAALLTFGEAPLDILDVPEQVRWLGWGLVATGFVLTVVAQEQMGVSWRIGLDQIATPLVTHGIYSMVRNPIFVGIMTVVTGLTLATPSGWTVMGWILYVFIIGLQVRTEEEHLLRMHGETYRAYASRTGRFLPGVGRLSAE